MNTVWIVVAIALALVAIILLLAISFGKIGWFSGWAKGKHGNNEFAVGAKIGESKLGKPTARARAKGNILRGEDHVISLSGNVEAEDNLLEGKRLKINLHEFLNEPRSDSEDKI